MIEVVREVKIKLHTKVQDKVAAAAFMSVPVDALEETIKDRMDGVAQNIAEEFNEGVDKYSGFEVTVTSEVV